MTIYAPATVPSIQYGYTTPYAALPKPPPRTILYDQVYNDDHVGIKCYLRNLLKRNKLSSMPSGFPFHWDCYETSRISHKSYEFREQFCFADQRARIQQATFVYSAPDPHARLGQRMMSWRIYLPARESAMYRDAPKTVSVAHVEVDSMVMETSFGIDLTTNPRIVLEALALSIELGLLVTIQVASYKTPKRYPSKRNIYYEPGDILFLATDCTGRSEVAYVFES
ncbi:hypothetical protein CVT25_006758 [Psilocybe cyanescens]|uniref:Uncharacterized protein n=1 Tax=Psilocybe cyanescens TaxID=93625 RepID=A0A409X7B4_PSICY|nr:hypothetical protein CVT25_006758 [Psilocybe cyanescens]